MKFARRVLTFSLLLFALAWLWLFALHFMKKASLPKANLHRSSAISVDKDVEIRQANNYWIDSLKIWTTAVFKQDGVEQHVLACANIEETSIRFISEIQDKKNLEIHAMVGNAKGELALVYTTSDLLLKAAIIDADLQFIDLGEIPVLYSYMLKGFAWVDNAPEIVVYKKEEPYKSFIYRWEDNKWKERTNNWHPLLHFQSELYMAEYHNNQWRNYIAFYLNPTTGKTMEDSVSLYLNEFNSDTIVLIGKYQINGDKDLWIDRASANIAMPNFSYATTTAKIENAKLKSFSVLDSGFSKESVTAPNRIIFLGNNCGERIHYYQDTVSSVFYFGESAFVIKKDTLKNFMGVKEYYYSIGRGILETERSALPVSKNAADDFIFYRLADKFVYFNKDWEFAVLDSDFDYVKKPRFFTRLFRLISLKGNENIKQIKDIFVVKMTWRGYIIPFFLSGLFILWFLQAFFLLLKRIFKKKKRYSYRVRRKKQKTFARHFLVVNICYLLLCLSLMYWFVIDSLQF